MKLAVVLLCSMGTAAVLRAETLRGTVSVRISGERVPGAAVRVAQHAFEASATSDAEGNFALELPAAGAYSVSVEQSGFRPFLQLDVQVNGSTELALELEIAAVREIVTVEDRLEEVRAQAPEVSQVVSGPQLRELPSNGRNLARFALLDPHVRNTNGLGADGSSGSRLSINASSFRHTAYVLDGATNYDSVFANAPQQTIGVGAVAEFKVLTNQYSAEYGTSTAGIAVAATKAGNNDVHGEAFWFARPSGVQAAPPVSPFRVPNERQQWGGSLGGPIRHDRTFAFGNYERVGQERGSFIQSPAPATFIGRLDEWYALTRIDQRWTDAHTSSFRFNGNYSGNNNVNDRVGGFFQPSAAQVSKQQAAGAQLTDHAAGARWVNEARYAYSNYVPSSTQAIEPQISIVRPNYSTEGGSTNSWVRAQSHDAADAFTWTPGSHYLKFGAGYTRQVVRDFSLTPFAEYRFAAGPPVPGQNPLTFSQTFGAGDIRYGQSIATAFVQDDYHPISRLTLNLGVRYERQSLTMDRNNFAPRLGLAYDLTGSGKTTLRGGAGMFYDQYFMYITRRFYLQGVDSPTATYTLPYGSPGFPVFPASLATPPPVSTGKRDLFLPADELLNPYSLQYSLGIQHSFENGWVFTADAIHTHTLKQMRVRDANAPAPFIRTAPGQRRSGTQADASRPYQRWEGVPVRNVMIVENSASSLYDALDLGVTKRMSTRYQFEAHYLYSSSAGYSMFFGEPNTGIPNDWSDMGRAERAPSDFYQRHRLVANGTAELPRGIRLSLISTAGSGLPVNPLTGTDNNGDTYAFDRPAGFGRNSFRMPGQVNLDVAISKSIRLTEHLRLELRAEVFNVTNRNNYTKVNAVYGEGPRPLDSFLQPVAGIANVDPSRQFQFAVRTAF